MTTTPNERKPAGGPRVSGPRIVALLVLVVAITVVAEGFALSWGSPPANKQSSSTPPTTETTIPEVNICSKGANYRFIQINYVRYGGGSELASVEGSVVTLHCGGPDDFQFYAHPTQETVRLRPHATITLMTLEPTFYISTLRGLDQYLASDEDGNIFRVTGPNSGATALTAMFHP